MLYSLVCNYFYKLLPKLDLQKIKLGDIHIATLGASESDSVFSAIACGVHKTWEGAVMRSFSEYVERQAYKASGIKFGDGFAAYPYIFLRKKAKKKAQHNAYIEMVERYAWPIWYKNQDIQYELKHDVEAENKDFYAAIDSDIPIKKLFVLVPKLELTELYLVVMYALTEHGLVCAGAVRSSIHEAEQNALKELYMHAIGIYRIKSQNIKPMESYDKRVFWIADKLNELEKRLNTNGNTPLKISLEVSYESISTEYAHAYQVQRCIFSGYKESFISEKKEMYV